MSKLRYIPLVSLLVGITFFLVVFYMRVREHAVVEGQILGHKEMYAALTNDLITKDDMWIKVSRAKDGSFWTKHYGASWPGIQVLLQDTNSITIQTFVDPH